MSAPLTGEDVALLQQAYLKGVIETDEMFNNVTIIAEDEGNIASQMDKALGIFTVTAGAAGACVIIRQPNGDDDMAGVLWPPLSLEWDILCLEHREMNKDTTKGGTGKRAWHMARRIHRIIKAHRAPGLVQCFTPRRPCIIRTSSMREMNGVEIPLVGYTVRIAAKEADDTNYKKTAVPLFSGNPVLSAVSPISAGSAGTILTVTSTGDGNKYVTAETIYYTTNLSHPGPKNPNAVLYTAPITAVAGIYLFRAYTSGAIGSDSSAVRFT